MYTYTRRHALGHQRRCLLGQSFTRRRRPATTRTSRGAAQARCFFSLHIYLRKTYGLIARFDCTDLSRMTIRLDRNAYRRGGESVSIESRRSVEVKYGDNVLNNNVTTDHQICSIPPISRLDTRSYRRHDREHTIYIMQCQTSSIFIFSYSYEGHMFYIQRDKKPRRYIWYLATYREGFLNITDSISHSKDILYGSTGRNNPGPGWKAGWISYSIPYLSVMFPFSAQPAQPHRRNACRCSRSNAAPCFFSLPSLLISPSMCRPQAANAPPPLCHQARTVVSAWPRQPPAAIASTPAARNDQTEVDGGVSCVRMSARC